MLQVKSDAYQYGAMRQLILDVAQKHRLNHELVAGVVYQESRGRPNAMRFEPRFYAKYIVNKKLKGFVPKTVSDETERMLRACSFGLMQVMGQVSRERGFEAEDLADLLVPEINLNYGCLILSGLMDAHQDTLRALFHYNAGGGAEYPGDGENAYGLAVLKAIDERKFWDEVL